MIGILAAIAKQERIRLSERTLAGLARARRQGKKLGRPRVTVDANQVAILRGQGLAWEAIATRLGVGYGTVRRALATNGHLAPAVSASIAMAD